MYRFENSSASLVIIPVAPAVLRLGTYKVMCNMNISYLTGRGGSHSFMFLRFDRIGWAHASDRMMRVDEYEEARSERREKLDLVLTRQDREEILLDWGVTLPEIIEAIRANIRIKNQRRRTVNSIGTYDRWEEVMERAGRTLKRTLLMQKPTSKQVKEMNELAQKRIAKAVGEDTPLENDSNSSPCRNSSLSSEITEPETSPEEHTLQSMGMQEHQPPPTPERMHQDSPDLVQDYSLEEDDHDGPPAPVLEVDVMDVGSQNSHTVMTNDDSDDYYYSSNHTTSDSSDGFESLVRDYSHWEVEGVDSPGIRRKMTPVVISEDGTYYDDLRTFDHHHHWENGFTVQPPPYSNTLISKWE